MTSSAVTTTTSPFFIFSFISFIVFAILFSYYFIIEIYLSPVSGNIVTTVLSCPNFFATSKAAHAAAALNPDRPTLIVAADTLVALGNEVLGKPLNRDDARRILSRLSGTRQEVISGLCLWPTPRGPEPLVESVSSWVTMRTMTPADVAAYVDSGEADGKAGAYAIQGRGALLVEGIEGDYSTVVGLPLPTLVRLLRRFGLDVWEAARAQS